MPNYRKFILHCVLSGIFVFLFAGLFLNISELKIFEVLNPIEETLSDMEISDLAVSQIRRDPKPDTNITVINVSHLDRAGIARQINIIQLFKPKVLGVDVFFFQEKDSAEDAQLAEALGKVENLVMASRLTVDDKGSITGHETSHEKFLTNARVGFANLDTEAKIQHDFKTCRNFPPQRMVDDSMYRAFALELASFMPQNHVDALTERNKEFEPIHYLGNAADVLNASAYGNVFNALDWRDVLTINFEPSMIRDKVVILGFMGQDFTDTSWDDRFYTPMNKRYVGKTNPDMYGVVVHANVVSMISNGRFIDEVRDSQGWTVLIAVFVCLFNMALFSTIHFLLPKWYDGLTKLIQLLELLIVLFFIVWAFDQFALKFSLLLSILVIVLSGDLLEVYYSFITNLVRKINEIFKKIGSVLPGLRVTFPAYFLFTHRTKRPKP